MKKETPATSSSEAFLDVSIMNGFETITRLGGYILMFAILSACISRWYIPHNVPGYLLTGILELTTGLYRLQPLILPDITKSILAVFLTASGGVCIAAQTRSLVTKELSVRSYIVAKPLNLSLIHILMRIRLFFSEERYPKSPLLLLENIFFLLMKRSFSYFRVFFLWVLRIVRPVLFPEDAL